MIRSCFREKSPLPLFSKERKTPEFSPNKRPQTLECVGLNCYFAMAV